VPPIAEQRKIAATLRALDDKIELNRRTNHTLESIAHAIFKSWFVDFDPVRKKMEGDEVGLPPDVAALFPGQMDGGHAFPSAGVADVFET
jgi:type I restriction enzyme S subunit